MNIEILTLTPKPKTLIGTIAGCAYSSVKNFSQIADFCYKHNHWRPFENAVITLRISGVSSKLVRQLFRHIHLLGTTQKSTRYVSHSNIDIIVPKSVKANPEAEALFRQTYSNTIDAMNRLEEMGIHKEDSTYLLPLGTDTEFCLTFNVRELLQVHALRTCTSAQWEIRDLFKNIKALIANSNDDEWNEIAKEWMVVKCIRNGFCDEDKRKSCGIRPVL